MTIRCLLILLCSLFLCHGSARAQGETPTAFDIVMLAGADYQLSLTITGADGSPTNLAGYSYRSQFRAAAAPAGALYATYSTAIVNAATGQMKITLSRAQTLANSGRTGLWDLLQIDNLGKHTYPMAGKAGVRATVTRP